jgi:hypothetical protein
MAKGNSHDASSSDDDSDSDNENLLNLHMSLNFLRKYALNKKLKSKLVRSQNGYKNLLKV